MDVEEFFANLFNKLCEENDEKIQEEFTGKILRTTTCKNCGTNSERNETILTLSLEVKGALTIDESLNRFESPEYMTGDDKYFCDVCKSKQDAEKTTRFVSLPDYLIISFKRFEYSVSEQKMITVNDKCAFHHKIKIQKKEFNLYAVIVHIGTSEGGHYVIFTKGNQNN